MKKVVAINGSPRKEGNTHFALTLMGEILKEKGIDFELVTVGNLHIRGCIDCRKCRENKDEKCVLGDNIVNDVIQKIKSADGVILGSPVYYSGIAGTMKALLDRVFFVARGNGYLFKNKIGTSVVAVRRTGGSATVDSLNHYLTLSKIHIASSSSWGILYGREIGEAKKDEEGIEIIKELAENIATLLNK